MADDIKQITEALGGMTEQVRLLHESLNKAAKSTELQSEALKGFRISSEAVKTQFDNLRAAAIRVADGTDKSTANFKRLAAEYRDSAEKARNLNEKTERLMKVYASGNPIITRLTQSVGLLKSGWATIASTMTLTGVSFGNLVGKVTEYNKAVFEVQRNSQVLGGGIKSLDAAYKSLGSTTSYSQKEFADLTQTFQNAYIGAGKSAESISKMASSLEKAFGPDLNAKKEALNSLLGVMNKFPALYDQIESVMNLAQSGGAVDQVAGMSAQMILIGRAAGMTANEFKTMGQAMMKPTAEQEKQIKLNRQMAEMTARWNNLILQAGQLMLPFLEGLMGILNRVGRIADGMGKWPAAITLATVAFAGLKTGAMAFDFVIGNVLKNLGKMALAKMGIGAAGKAAGGVVDAVTSGAPKLSLAKDAPAVLAREAASKGGLLSRGIGAFKASPRLMGMAKGGIASAAGVVMEMGGDYLKTSKNKTVQQVGKATSALGSTVAGAGTGALIGSLLLPGLGTVIGGALGGLVGGLRGINKEYNMMGDKTKSQNEELAKMESKYGIIEDASKNVNKAEEQKLTTMFKINAEYMKQQMNLKAVQAMSESILSSNASILKSMTDLGVIDPAFIQRASQQGQDAVREKMKQLDQSGNVKYMKGGPDDLRIQAALGRSDGIIGIKQEMGIDPSRDMTGDEITKLERKIADLFKAKAQSKEGLGVDVPTYDGQGGSRRMEGAEAKNYVVREKAATQQAIIAQKIGGKQVGLDLKTGNLEASAEGFLNKYQEDKASGGKDFKENAAAEELIKLRQKLIDLATIEETIRLNGLDAIGQTASALERQVSTYQAQKEIGEQIAAGLRSEADQTDAITAIQLQKIKNEQAYYEASGQGVGPSLKSQQEQLSVLTNSANVWKNTAQDADALLATMGKQNNLSEQSLELFKNALTPQQRIDALMKSGNMSEEKALELNAKMYKVVETRTEAIGKEKAAMTEVYNISKNMAEAYFDSLPELAVNAGEFAAIIGNQTRGVDQIFGQINKYTQSGKENVFNSRKVGGIANDDVRERGYRSNPLAKTEIGGVLTYNSPEALKQQARELAMFDAMNDPNSKQNKPEIAGDVVTPVGARERDSGARADKILSDRTENEAMTHFNAAEQQANLNRESRTPPPGGEIGKENMQNNQTSPSVAPPPTAVPKSFIPPGTPQLPNPPTAVVPGSAPYSVNSWQNMTGQGYSNPPAVPVSEVTATSSKTKVDIVLKLGPQIIADFNEIKSDLVTIKQEYEGKVG